MHLLVVPILLLAAMAVLLPLMMRGNRPVVVARAEPEHDLPPLSFKVAAACFLIAIQFLFTGGMLYYWWDMVHEMTMNSFRDGKGGEFDMAETVLTWSLLLIALLPAGTGILIASKYRRLLLVATALQILFYSLLLLVPDPAIRPWIAGPIFLALLCPLAGRWAKPVVDAEQAMT